MQWQRLCMYDMSAAMLDNKNLNTIFYYAKLEPFKA